MERTEKAKLITSTSSEALGAVNRLSAAKGIAAMLGFVVMASTSRICVQMLEKAVPDFELNAIRCGFTLPCMAVYFAATKTWPTVNRENWISVSLLCLFSNIVNLTLYISVTMIPLASCESVFVTCQITLSIVIFTFINKEKVTWDKALAIPVCTMGVILVLQPPFMFHKQNGVEFNSTFTNYTHQSDGQIDQQREDTGDLLISTAIGYVLAVICGVSTNICSSITKYSSDFYTKRNILISLIWTNVVGTMFSVIVMLIVEEPILPVSFRDTVLVGGHCFAYVLLMPFFMYGSLLISGSLGAIIRSLNLLIVLAAQYLLMKDIFPGHRNWMEVFGVILVLLGAIFSSIIEIVKMTLLEKNPK